MQEAVSSILIGRSREADGLSRMVLISLVDPRRAADGARARAARLAAHAARGRSHADDDFPRAIGHGGHGRDDGDHERGRCRQSRPTTKPVNAPPAAKTPEMVAPAPDVKPKPVTKPVEKPVEKSATKQAVDRPGDQERRRARGDAERRPGPVRRAGRARRREQRRRAAPRRRQLLLSRVRRDDEPAHPLELGSAAGRGRADGREVHDSPRRHAGQRRGREDAAATRCSISNRSAPCSTRGSCLPFRLSSIDRR